MALSFLGAIKQRTITRDLTLGLTITIILATTSVSFLYFISAQSSAEQLLQEKALEHVDRLSTSLEKPLLMEDEIAILRTSFAYQEREHLAALRVVDAGGKAVYDVVLDAETALTTATKPVHWYGTYVGSVEVSLSKKAIIEARQRTLYLTVLITLSVIAAVSVASTLLLKRFLSKPLAAVAQGIEVIAGGSYDHVLAPVHRRDIDLIIEEINVMAGQIAAREERLKRLVTAVEQADEAIAMMDRDGKIQYVNPAFEKVHGYSREDAVGEGLGLFIDNERRDMRKEIGDTLARGSVWRGHIVGKRADGSPYEIESAISPVRDEKGRIINFVVVNRDVTEQIRLERQVRQTQKLEAIGTLAGGIAHDFNNIITPVIGFAELLLDELDGPINLEQRGDLERIVAAGMRAKDMVGQILTFARKGEYGEKPQPARLGPLIKEALKLLKASLPSTIELQHSVEIEHDTVLVDPTQIHQVLINLCTNAAHAIGEEPGRVDVTLAEVEVDSDFVAQHPALKEGSYVRLTVTDTGCGMPREIVERIFEPFYTTKKAGKGTGMGLSVVHGIVTRYGGTVVAYSEPGRGSTFHVYLPRAGEAVPARPAVEEPIPRGAESILFVDDEEMITELAKKFLGGLGYRVETFTSSVDAVERFRNAPQAFDLVVTDLTMPKLTGLSLIREILRVRPGTPAILCTGFSGALLPEVATEAGAAEVVLKPLTARSLGTAVRRALDRAAGGSASETPRG